MAVQTIKVGDVVVLKSGGPKMTVDRIGRPVRSPNTESAWCNWFDSDNKQQNGVFALESLAIYEQPDDSPAWSDPKPCRPSY